MNSSAPQTAHFSKTVPAYGLVWPLKIVPPLGGGTRNRAFWSLVTRFLEWFSVAFKGTSGVSWVWALAIRPLRVLGWPCPVATPLPLLSRLEDCCHCFVLG